VNDLTAKGWDQDQYLKILDWYQQQVKKFSSTTAGDLFPNGKLYLTFFLKNQFPLLQKLLLSIKRESMT
jgi:hypothetical protein